MKKFVLAMFTVALATCFVACKTDGTKPAGEGENQQEQVDAKAPLPTVTIDDMKALVEKATKEGKDWSEDQWKDAMRTMMIGMKPMFDALMEFQKKSEDPETKKKLDEDPAAALAALGELQKAMEQYKPMDELMDQFSKAADASPVAKNMEEDTVWMNKLIEEIGLPKDAFK
ncbi:MAG: hypothetical protein IJT30_10695 [Muribaculaceae bacterium]|nr:hypothetical protein [Muribaculaceae bacterium]